MTITVDYRTARPADVPTLLAARRALRERHLAEVAADDAAIAELELVASLDEDAACLDTLDHLTFYTRPLPVPYGDNRWNAPLRAPDVGLPSRDPGAAVPVCAYEFHPERGDPERN